MVKTIFKNTFLVGCTVLLFCAALFFGIRYTQIREETYEVLRQETVYAAEGLMLSGQSYLDTLGDINRVTWFDTEGKVLYDSRAASSQTNNNIPPEVQDAMISGSGRSIRNSESLGEKSIYYALRCGDGSILRLSRPINALTEALSSLSLLFWILVFLLLISIVLSFRIANKIVKPINTMDLDDPSAAPYPELGPLVERIQEQSLTIREEAVQREKLRREFSANVSHELKTPLTSISGFAELMSQGLVAPEKIPEFSGDIYRESQRLIALVEDILRLSKLDENAIAPDWEMVDLYDLASDTLETLRLTAKQQNVSLCLKGEHLSVRGIRSLLTEMVYNLCDNAIKYNRYGGNVTVTVSSSAPDILLQVSDNGIGIPKDKQDRVFERFFRVDKSHSKGLGGTGLGLSIVKHGAQFHGADIQLNSELGKGTSITLCFPPKAEDEDTLPAETPVTES